jgi:pyruvate dehydrogenase E2 component (dihydrolipoamide acetyltransferase)
MADSREVTVPDIGDFTDVPVIEILVSEGDEVSVEQPLVTLESDKATMDVPAPFAGKVAELKVSVGDEVSEGSVLMVVEASGDGVGPSDEGADEGADREAEGADREAEGADREAEGADREEPSADAGEGADRDGGSDGGEVVTVREAESQAAAAPAPDAERRETAHSGPESDARRDGAGDGPVYASPAVRRLAREMGVELRSVSGTGRKGRITKDDVKQAKERPAAAAPAEGAAIPGLNLAPWPKVDFEKYGEVERVPLSRIKKISGPNVARNWVMIPHVTQNDEADITDLEAFRKQINAEQSDVKVTMVALLVKASVGSLKQFPDFNSSLDGDELVIKRYYNIGFAADTPQGLMVPVIKDADRKGLLEIAGDLTELSGKAREGKISAEEMRGSTFSISSLGGIGGTSFTPIVNAPDVAILGVSRSKMAPVWDGEAFQPRLMLPLSLSYDHRVIDGAAAARFVSHLAGELADLRRVLL